MSELNKKLDHFTSALLAEATAETDRQETVTDTDPWLM